MQIILRNFRPRLTPTLLRLFAAALLLGIVLAQMPVPNAQAQAPLATLTLTKTIDGGVTTARVGDVIFYRIHFACSSLTTDCGAMEITDVLQAGLTYLPPPDSSVPAGGYTMSYDSPTRTIKITHPLMTDGSQADAVIAVRVDYDLRPLPADINNIATGRIMPPGTSVWLNSPPAVAPTISIGTVTPSWGLAKTLYRPSINPTINTDVTYRIRLCPTTPPAGQGNTPLLNIVITDTMPVGASFVSASDGGTDSTPVSGTVTWPVIAGPIYPPNCVTRYVTIRYNSPLFSVGDSVTNSASANGDYTNSLNVIGPVGTITGPITHPIAAIVEVPTYSKNDQGDPIGITATGRFVLNLNTNATNYPSNSLILIDNLPPELQVTSVTSGQWDSSFNYVQAYVEYSTDNGGSYTPFPDPPVPPAIEQPAGYNTNATYTAPVTTITNVRWRFEYDPTPNAIPPFSFTQAGLPYGWAFTASPQIRVTPRAVAVVGPPLLPAAVAGTYTNCLQVSRVSSAGPVVTETCDNETMTVQGNIVSLRVSKDEKMGAGWDDVSDPLINAFALDGNLLPGDTLHYTITVAITERSSADLISPTILDTFPADLVFVRNGTAQVSGTGCPALTTQPIFSQPAVDQLQWDFPSLTITPLALDSCSLTVQFFARIPPGQTPGARTNSFYVANSTNVVCEIAGTARDATSCESTDTYTVERSAALRGEKWIRSTDALNSQVVDSTTFLPPAIGFCPNGGTAGLPGGGSNPFTRYPCISQAFPDGALSPGQIVPPPVSTTLDDFEYNLRIFNDGNVPMLRYVLYDILPYIGDTGSGGTLASSPRNSEFRPRLRGPIVFISGPGGLTAADFIIQYNATTNPCRPEVFDQPTGSAVPAGCNNVWTTTWSTSARSFRIRLDDARLPAPVIANAVPAGQELRFGVPMNIPAPLGGADDADDAQSHEIAWNSFAHVGSYDKALTAPVVIQDLLASEPRKVGITVPEVMSVGNRVWRDSDNSGTINAPDDLAPGIAAVTVNLYRDVDNNGTADGPAIAVTTTDSGGYYLFSNIPYDSAVMNNNRYLIGIPASNFGPAPTAPLFNLRSSTGTPAVPAYTDPPSNNADQDDNGRDPSTPGLEVFSANFILQPGAEPAAEADLSANNRDGPAGTRRGVNGERNNNSDLTLDFGFFGGTDVPFSLGNHIWYDDGYTAPGVFNYAFNNDGIRQSTELPVVGVMVRLYRDGDANGILIPAEMIRTDLTDTNGFYLFDNLDPGPYYVEIPATEFAAGKPLAGWNSSQTTGTENTGVPGNTNTPNMDSDDNGVDTASPETNGVFSGVIVLTRGVNEQTAETHLSNQPDPDGNPLTPNLGVNPTEWDGPDSRGRYGETDTTSNLTIDFGFFPVYSLGNRVWNDNGANPGGGGVPDDGIRNGDEPGINGVTVNLYRDSNDDGVPDGGIIATMNTAGGGYYRFDNLMADTYIVEIVTPAGYASSPVDAGDPDVDADDNDDNGVVLVMSGAKIRSNPVTLGRGAVEPINDDDPTPGPEVGEAADDHSNRTVDFALTTGYSLGNRVWYDTNNDGAFGVVEEGINGVRVNLHRDTNSNGMYDAGDIFVGFETTDANGYYRFDGLPVGGYVVVIPADNFRNIGAGDTVAGDPLTGYLSSGTSIAGAGAVSDSFGPDPDTTATDSDDNGVSSFTSNRLVYVSAQAVTLGGLPLEPTGEEPSPNPAAGEAPDDHSDRTVDFGFYRLQLSNQIFVDINPDGTYVASDDTPLAGAKVQVYASDGATEILVGPDGILGTADDAAGGVTTLAGGVYLFGGLPAGNYIVKVTPLLADSTSTIDAASIGDTMDPNTNTDNNDNGIGVSTGQVSSGIVTLTPGQGIGGAPGAANNTVTNSTGTTANPTLDFGFSAFPLIGVAKRVVGTPALVSPGTWDVTFAILVKNYGNVALSNVQVTDDLANPDAAPSAFPPLAAYTVTGVSTSSNLTANAGYNGNSDTRLLDPAAPAGQNQLDPDEEGTITLMLRVVPTKSSENTAIASGEPPVGAPVTDNSQDGVDPDPTPKDGNPTNNNDPTPVTFGPGLFDPPIGFKVFDDTGLPMLQWTMTWINSANITAINARVSDPIPPGTTYAAIGAPNIYPAPVGAPAGSTNVGVTCSTPSPLVTITTLCYYEGPTPAYSLGRVVWEGTLGPDFGHLTAATAVNELDIIFKVNIPSESRVAYNVAAIDVDRNGDSMYAPGETTVASSQALWTARESRERDGDGKGANAKQLPATGFAPGAITILPEQPADKAYFDTGDIWLEIPRLDIKASIAGIPQADDGTWDVSWLWGQAGWLQGTAYPTWKGNSAITGHVYLPNGKPGPFVDVNKLAYGDKIIVHAFGQKYIYEVRENKKVKPGDTSVLKHEDKAWVTLLTCLGYNEANNTYASRVAVRAVLMTVEEDKTSTPNKDR